MTTAINSQVRSTFSLRKVFSLLLFALVFAFSLVLPTGAAWANTTGDDDMLRVNDFVEVLSDSDQSKLSRMAKNEVNSLKFDFVAVIDDTESSTDERAKSFYEHNDFGFGKNDNGIILFISTKTGKASIYTCGDGTKIFSDEDLKAINKAVKKTAGSSYYDAVYLFFNNAVCKVAEYRGVSVESNWNPEAAVVALTTSVGGGSGASEASGNAGESNTPANASKTTMDLAWYPKDPSKFEDFHCDKSVSRVVDNADLLTDEEEQQLAEKIAGMQERTGLDFVLYTDTSSYGLSRDVLAADFYQFNGYGFDDEYSGVVYFVCMQPDNRGFWTASCGKARELLTEGNVNTMDDATYSYFKNGNYGTAIATQFDNLDYLYTNGKLPFDWMPFAVAGFVGSIAGIVYGFINLFRKRRQMKTVASAVGAGSYIEGAPRFTVRRDRNLGATVKRIKREKESDSGGGGGRSSYSGSYSSSGGRSFSGGGRGF